ncbi:MULTISPECIES: hypothetical protein [Cyanophyceae]|uniref:hypothetical protein n=1 Tax=Cyanophyceae TaxID=3028117 RepID=UPI0016870FC8|nr:hypothetical protein [Trichocoleus sp. FACHB-69]MBD1935607.1 hypothetical protein [Trichocoleus sp. FACHB-69]
MDVNKISDINEIIGWAKNLTKSKSGWAKKTSNSKSGWAKNVQRGDQDGLSCSAFNFMALSKPVKGFSL